METLAYALLVGLIAREAFGVPLLPSDIKPFIYGGEDAPEGYAPYMAALVIGDRVKSQWCGGSIISRNLILSTANCVGPLIMEDGSLFETFHIRVGSNQWNSGGNIINVKDFHIHPKFDYNNYYKYDVAILVTAVKIVLSEKVAIIGLAFDYVGENEKCLVAGWGRTGPRMEGDVLHMQPTPDDLQALYTTTMSYKRCQERIMEITGGRGPSIEDAIELCTFHSVGHGMCSGDGGNALVRVSNVKQIAIVSWGTGCADGGPDVSVRISGYSIKEFLESILNMYHD